MTRRKPSEYNWPKLEFDETILTKHFTKQASKNVKFIVVHHMTIIGDGKGKALDGCWNTWQTRQASAHYGVDGLLVRQYVWDKDYAWATGSTGGNRDGISIEHANSTGGPDWKVSDDTWKTGAKLAARLHLVYGLGRPVKDKTLRKHGSFIATGCPGPYLGDKIWSKYVAEAQRVYDLIATVQPAPVPKPSGPLVKSASLNAGSYNATGAKTFKSRVDKYAIRRLASRVDILNLQEVGNGIGTKAKPNCRMRGRLDLKLAPAYRRHIGSDGRYNYSNRTSVKPIKSGKITAAKSTWYRGDDKQASYIVYTKDGVRAMDVSFHLENESGAEADAERVAQMLSIVAQALVIAKAQKVDRRNILFAGDTNSEGMVERAMLAAGWRNVATNGPREHARTFTGWDGRGDERLDYGFVHITAGPATLDAVIADTGVGDHAELVITRELTN